MRGTHMSLVCRATTAHFSFLSTKEHSMAKEGTGFNSKVTVGESKTCKDDPLPFNERQLAWLTSVMAKEQPSLLRPPVS